MTRRLNKRGMGGRRGRGGETNGMVEGSRKSEKVGKKCAGSEIGLNLVKKKKEWEVRVRVEI